MKCDKKTKGFSLLEVMITTAIFVIAVGVITFNQNKNSSQNDIIHSSQTVFQIFKKAQNMAMSSKPTISESGKSPCGFGIHINISLNSNQLILFADFPPANDCYDANNNYLGSRTYDNINERIEVINLEKNIIFLSMKDEAFPNPNQYQTVDIIYIPPEPQTSIYTGTLQDILNISLANIKDFTNGKIITVRKSGQISITPTVISFATDAICGNGIVESSEQCDVGDVVSGDGCSSSCLIEQSLGSCSSNCAIRGMAWSEQVGWINFGATNGGAVVSDLSLSGYVWSDNLGWINLNPAQGGVINNGMGILSGYAWSEIGGWINFTGVSINIYTGAFSGYAFGENFGWINFNNVISDWGIRL